MASRTCYLFTTGCTAVWSNATFCLFMSACVVIMFDRISKIIWGKTKIFYADLPHFVLIWINIWVKVIVWKNEISDKKFLKILEKYEIDTTFSPPYRY